MVGGAVGRCYYYYIAVHWHLSDSALSPAHISGRLLRCLTFLSLWGGRSSRSHLPTWRHSTDTLTKWQWQWRRRQGAGNCDRRRPTKRKTWKISAQHWVDFLSGPLCSLLICLFVYAIPELTSLPSLYLFPPTFCVCLLALPSLLCQLLASFKLCPSQPQSSLPSLPALYICKSLLFSGDIFSKEARYMRCLFVSPVVCQFFYLYFV